MMSKDKSPAFQFYPKDWLSDARVRAMGREARGVYIDLLALYWNEGGLPSDTEQLARIAGVPHRTFERLWTLIAPCFGITGPALASKRLDREKAKQTEYRNAQALKGQKSAKSRLSNKTDEPRLESGSSPVEPRLEPKSNSPFPSPFPSPTKQTTEVPPPRARETEPPPPEPTDAECQTAADELVKALHRAKEVTGLDGADILAHSTVRGKGAVIVNPSVCSPAALKLWRIAAERVYGFVAAWEADQREAQGKRGKAKGKAPAWDRGDMGAADLTAQAVEWVRARWPVGAPSSRAELEARLAAIDPPAELRGEILTHLLFGRYPSLATAGRGEAVAS